VGFTINRKEPTVGDLIKPGRRLWLTADRGRVVEDGDPDAAFLWCGGPDDEVLADEAEGFGFKETKPAADKERRPAGTKGRKADDVDGGVDGDG
jgi:hypothetical protein